MDRIEELLAELKTETQAGLAGALAKHAGKSPVKDEGTQAVVIMSPEMYAALNAELADSHTREQQANQQISDGIQAVLRAEKKAAAWRFGCAASAMLFTAAIAGEHPGPLSTAVGAVTLALFLAAVYKWMRADQ